MADTAHQCPVCYGLIDKTDAVVFVHGEVMHSACAPAAPALGPSDSPRES